MGGVGAPQEAEGRGEEVCARGSEEGEERREETRPPAQGRRARGLKLLDAQRAQAARGLSKEDLQLLLAAKNKSEQAGQTAAQAL